jgi:drug/metabolite transporter (DMT)-like permease
VKTKIAYLVLIAIWGTTPLAIKWSTEGSGYLFGIAGRMLLGFVVACVIIVVIRAPMPWHRRAIQTYLAGGFGIYCAMGSVYWGAQFIPSGWVSVVFGLSPILTGAMAALMLREDALSRYKIAGIILGIVGLVVIFGHGATLGRTFLLGAAAVFVGTAFHALSAVLIKRIDAEIGGFASTAGSLAFAVPLLLATWWWVDGKLPDVVPVRAALSIVYLGIIASAIGFALYYYVLRRMDVSRLSLIALITPVIALLLGNVLNNEPVGSAIVIGAACIVTGLLIYEFGHRLRPLLSGARQPRPHLKP